MQIVKQYNIYTVLTEGATVAVTHDVAVQLVEALHGTLEGRGSYFQWCHWNF